MAPEQGWSMKLLSAAVFVLQGALGVNTALFSFSFVVFNFLATATTPLIAAAVSAGNREQVPVPLHPPRHPGS